MPSRLVPRLLFTACIAVGAAYLVVTGFHGSGLPLNITVTDARTAVITPLHGVALPPGVEAGDRLDLAALDRAARTAAIQTIDVMSGIPPAGRRYDFVLLRGTTQLTVPVVATGLGGDRASVWVEWLTLCLAILTALIGLLAMWRGRDWAAAGLAVWMFAQMIADILGHLPLMGVAALSLGLVPAVLFLVARAGFYVMAESMVGPGLAPRVRWLFRGVFALLLLLGGLNRPGGALIYAATGWAELLRPGYGLLLSLSYLPSVLILAVAYRHAELDQRLRLRWMLWGGITYLGGVLIIDTQAAGPTFSPILAFCLYVIAFLTILYAVLRHRVVKLSVAVNHTLVYGGVTALVVGLIAAVNNLALKFALPPGAGLLLQVVVPLALGIVLSKLRAVMDTVVERVFFRSRYLTEQALCAFARRCGHIDRAQDLLDAVAREVTRHLHVPAVAIYSADERGFRLVHQAGSPAYPAELGNNDDAVVAIRAEGKVTDLDRLSSALGSNSCVLPMLVLGNLRGLLVVRNRPGEHFGADEKALLAEVAQDVGAAWRILRARENEALVVALAGGDLKTLKVARDKARALTLAW